VLQWGRAPKSADRPGIDKLSRRVKFASMGPRSEERG